MTPAANTSASVGIGGAIIEIVSWACDLAHVPMPPSVAVAFATLITGAIGYGLHVRSLTPNPTNAAPSA